MAYGKLHWRCGEKVYFLTSTQELVMLDFRHKLSDPGFVSVVHRMEKMIDFFFVMETRKLLLLDSEGRLESHKVKGAKCTIHNVIELSAIGKDGDTEFKTNSLVANRETIIVAGNFGNVPDMHMLMFKRNMKHLNTCVVSNRDAVIGASNYAHRMKFFRSKSRHTFLFAMSLFSLVHVLAVQYDKLVFLTSFRLTASK